MVKLYDPDCFELAKNFLDDSDAHENGNDMNKLYDLLAKSIQEDIEYFFAFHNIH